MTQDKAKIGLETVTKKSQNNKLVDGFLTPDMANNGQMTLTERGQSNQIKKQNDQDLIDLFTLKDSRQKSESSIGWRKMGSQHGTV